MIIFSAFDGMSCAQIALIELGYKIDTYYSSEVDKFAIQQTQYNFPNTIQLGDIRNIKAKDLKRIDLFVGGSPCQGFSFAGKQLNFNDPRSALFFEYVRLWNEIKEINPDAKFLLENVNMKKEYLRIISEYLEVFPVRINSNLVSAQNRDRWYWTNIKTKETGLFSELWSDIPQPEDKGILLKDILQPEKEIYEKYYIKKYPKLQFLQNYVQFDCSNKGYKSQQDRCFFENNKHGTLSSSRTIDKTGVIKLNKQGNKKANQNKSDCLTGGGHSGGNHSDMDIICVAMRGRENGQELE